jgi:hypothetical protein
MLAHETDLALEQRAPDGVFVRRVGVVILRDPEIDRGLRVVAAQLHGRLRRSHGDSVHGRIFSRSCCGKMAISAR